MFSKSINFLQKACKKGVEKSKESFQSVQNIVTTKVENILTGVGNLREKASETVQEIKEKARDILEKKDLFCFPIQPMITILSQTKSRKTFMAAAFLTTFFSGQVHAGGDTSTQAVTDGVKIEQRQENNDDYLSKALKNISWTTVYKIKKSRSIVDTMKLMGFEHTGLKYRVAFYNSLTGKNLNIRGYLGVDNGLTSNMKLHKQVKKIVAENPYNKNKKARHFVTTSSVVDALHLLGWNSSLDARVGYYNDMFRTNLSKSEYRKHSAKYNQKLLKKLRSSHAMMLSSGYENILDTQQLQTHLDVFYPDNGGIIELQDTRDQTTTKDADIQKQLDKIYPNNSGFIDIGQQTEVTK